MKVGMHVVLSSFLLLMSAPCWGGLSQSDREFIKKYEVDPEVKAILDEHAQELSHRLDQIQRSGVKEHATWKAKWLPGYFIKFNLARIHGMERMKRCIKRNNLDLIDVPDKRIYHVKGRGESLHNMNYLVVVKAIPLDPNAKPMTLDHVKQLAILMKETHYISTTATNYIRTFNGKLVMIDTESTFDSTKLLSKGFMRLISAYHIIDKDYTQEALQYIIGQMAMLLKHSKAKERAGLSNQIRRFLRKAKNPTWNYVDYFENKIRAH